MSNHRRRALFFLFRNIRNLHDLSPRANQRLHPFLLFLFLRLILLCSNPVMIIEHTVSIIIILCVIRIRVQNRVRAGVDLRVEYE